MASRIWPSVSSTWRRQSRLQVASAHDGRFLLEPGRRRPNGDFAGLGRALADQQIVRTSAVIDDLLVDFVAGNANAVAYHHAAQGDDRDFGGPPPMSTIMLPLASWIGCPAPMAAAIGSSIK